MLEIRDLEKTFARGTVNEHTALDGIDLTLPDGDFVTILGSNGAGKSTLFNAITGAFWPDRGAIRLDGENITYQPEHVRARKIGILFQDPMKGTAPDMTVAENLALAYTHGRRFPLARALQKKDADFLRDRLAAFHMGLEDRMKMKVGLLSGGQRQAMTLLMATVAEPRLLLLDEHTAALDPATAEKVLDITVRTVRERRLTTLMITHNMQSALALGNRTLMMERGKIILDLAGEERDRLRVEDLLRMYSGRQGRQLDNDRMLLGK
ncbi:MAG: ATP-binding cassette domain-containing protein [Clostridiales bacterium]|nr:ATP-binding cassette domain-containing protein [Clostridiales bacterium]